MSRFVSRARTRRRLVLLAATAAVAALLGGLADRTGVLSRAEGAGIDARFALRGARHVSTIVVVGIDDPTLTAPGLPRWPWPRSLQGRLIRDVHALHPRLIVYDVEVISPNRTPQNVSLYNAVAASAPVVMVTSRVGAGGATPILGGNRNLAAAAAFGAYSQFPAPGGEVRRMSTGLNGLPSVALVAARAVGDRVRPAPSDAPLIDFPGGAGTVPEVPAVNVLDHRADARRLLRGRIAVIGTTDPTLHDIHATAAGGGSLLSGPELQADAIATALAGFPLRPAPGCPAGHAAGSGLGIHSARAGRLALGGDRGGGRARLAVRGWRDRRPRVLRRHRAAAHRTPDRHGAQRRRRRARRPADRAA